MEGRQRRTTEDTGRSWPGDGEIESRRLWFARWLGDGTCESVTILDVLPNAGEDELDVRERLRRFGNEAERVPSPYVVCPSLDL